MVSFIVDNIRKKAATVVLFVQNYLGPYLSIEPLLMEFETAFVVVVVTVFAVIVMDKAETFVALFPKCLHVYRRVLCSVHKNIMPWLVYKDNKIHEWATRTHTHTATTFRSIKVWLPIGSNTHPQEEMIQWHTTIKFSHHHTAAVGSILPIRIVYV